MSIRVVRGEIGSKDVTARVIIPTAAQPKWPPFERVAETIATPRRPFPLHKHERTEVLTYVIEGSAFYTFGSGTPEPMEPGSTKLLMAAISASHTINSAKGQTVRWFSVVATLPPGNAATNLLQSSRPVSTEMQPDGTVVQPLVGPHSTLTSAAGLDCEAIRFAQEGTSFRRIGHDRVALVYAFLGPGEVDNNSLEAGEAALVEDAAGIALKGEPGFGVILCSAPRTRTT
jgi:redox-sensitive bicupin YhaK (pirin superfamily)